MQELINYFKEELKEKERQITVLKDKCDEIERFYEQELQEKEFDIIYLKNDIHFIEFFKHLKENEDISEKIKNHYIYSMKTSIEFMGKYNFYDFVKNVARKFLIYKNEILEKENNNESSSTN